MVHSRLSVTTLQIVLVLALLACGSLPALASVDITSFVATIQPDNSILVVWQVAAEVDTSGYRLYRSETESPSNWGLPIVAFPAGGAAPKQYSYLDHNITLGVLYYYLLEDVSNPGVTTSHGPISAVVGVPGDDATSTATTQPGTDETAVPGSVTPSPPATRRVAGASLTPTVRPIQTARAPLLTAVVSAPTQKVEPLPTAVAPASAPSPTTLIPTATPTVSSTPQPVVVRHAGLESATPQPEREATPIIFEAARATPFPTPSPATQTDRGPAPALMIGAASLGLAGILAAAVLFVRSSRQ